jgi:hypothetical protein
MEDYTIYFDPSTDKVLGVFDKLVHVEGRLLSEDSDEDVVLIIPKKEYLRVWSNWLSDKQRMCGLWKHYCGVMGTTNAINPILQDFTIDVNIWDEENEDYVTQYRKAVYCKKFEDRHDFEHG